MKDKTCGMCGEKDFNKLVGPFAGGPYPYYCKDCHLIVDDYLDMHVHPRNPDSALLLRKWLKAAERHEQFIKSLNANQKETT